MGTRDKRNQRVSNRIETHTPDASDYGIKELQHELAGRGLYIKEILGDGNCLFRSLADQLGDTNGYARIRHDVVQYLRDKQADFQVFVEEDYDQYVNRMSNDGVYGDNIEIVAFANCRNKVVKIYQPGLTYMIKPAGQEDACFSDKDMLHIVYHSYEHYSSVRNNAGPHEGPSNINIVSTSAPAPRQRKLDAPASDLEKICLASVPRLSLVDVRATMASCHGNVNAAIAILLDKQEEVDMADVFEPGSDSVTVTARDLVASSEPADPVKLQPVPSSEVSGVKGPKPAVPRLSARDRKEAAKKAQKLAARERKRSDKTNAACHSERDATVKIINI